MSFQWLQFFFFSSLSAPFYTLSGTFLSPLLIGLFARVSFAEVTVCCAFLCFFPPSGLAAQMFLCCFDFGLPHSPVCLSNQQRTKKMFSPSQPLIVSRLCCVSHIVLFCCSLRYFQDRHSLDVFFSHTFGLCWLLMVAWWGKGAWNVSVSSIHCFSCTQGQGVLESVPATVKPSTGHKFIMGLHWETKSTSQLTFTVV